MRTESTFLVWECGMRWKNKMKYRMEYGMEYGASLYTI